MIAVQAYGKAGLFKRMFGVNNKRNGWVELGIPGGNFDLDEEEE